MARRVELTDRRPEISTDSGIWPPPSAEILLFPSNRSGKAADLPEAGARRERNFLRRGITVKKVLANRTYLKMEDFIRARKKAKIKK